MDDQELKEGLKRSMSEPAKRKRQPLHDLDNMANFIKDPTNPRPGRSPEDEEQDRREEYFKKHGSR